MTLGQILMLVAAVLWLVWYIARSITRRNHVERAAKSLNVEARIEYLQQCYTHAKQRGNVARADQLEAELRDLAAKR